MIRNASKRFASNSFGGCGILKHRLLSTCSALPQKHKESIVPFSMKDSFRYSPEEGYVRTSAYNDVQLQNMTIDQYIWKDLHQFQDKSAIVSGFGSFD